MIHFLPGWGIERFPFRLVLDYRSGYKRVSDSGFIRFSRGNQPD
jgi:hypothetical protein